MQTKRKSQDILCNCVTKLGAPRSIDIPVVTNLQRLGYGVSWFGINIGSCLEFTGSITSLNISKISSFRRKSALQNIKDTKIPNWR